MILVDSSVLIPFLSGTNSRGADILHYLETQDIPYSIPTVCAQEVLQGARDLKEWRVLDQYLGSQTLIDSAHPRQTHFAAARIYFDCRRRGFTIRSTIDCFVAQLCLDYDASLLHEDRDYRKITKVRPLKFARAI
jgi:hypothetical protein